MRPRNSVAATRCLNRDQSCRVTNYREGTQTAHLLSKSEKNWADANGMLRYSKSRTTEYLESEENFILLRSDVHAVFDALNFTFVPKSQDDGKLHWTVHSLNSESAESIQLYHNVRLLSLCGIRKEFIFAAFARAIIQISEQTFLHPCDKRAVLVCSSPHYTTEVKEMTFGDMRSLRPPRSLNQSPRNRSPDALDDLTNESVGVALFGLSDHSEVEEEEEDPEVNEVKHLMTADMFANGEFPNDLEYAELRKLGLMRADDYEPPRGRKRRRSRSRSFTQSSPFPGPKSPSRRPRRSS